MRSGDERCGRLIADPSSVDKERHGAPQYWESHNVALVCWKNLRNPKSIEKVRILHLFAENIQRTQMGRTMSGKLRHYASLQDKPKEPKILGKS